MKTLIIFFVIAITCGETFAETVPIKLHEAFQSALKRSEDIANQEQLIVQAEEKLAQAKGAILPTINGSYTFLTQGAPSSGTATSFSPQSQNMAKITATQPLFRGLREFAALRQQKNNVSSSQLAKAQATQQLYQDFVQNYFQVLSSERDIANTQDEIDLNLRRLKELDHFRQIGRSRPSEVLTLKANIAALEATQESYRSVLENNRAIFGFLTGLEPKTPIADSEPMPNRNVTIAPFLARIESRPDVQSLVQSALAAEEGTSIARGGHFPSVDAVGNYYFVRPGLLSNVNWDAQLLLTIPIFQGGIIQSQVRQAASVEKQSDLALSRARRQAKQQIESLFGSFQSDYAQYEKQKTAVELGLKTYNTNLKDYSHGLVTNLDVLQSLTLYEQSQRLLDRALLQVKSDYLRLQAAAALAPFPPKEGG